MVDGYIDLMGVNLSDREKDAVLLLKSGHSAAEVMKRLKVTDIFMDSLRQKVLSAEKKQGLNVSHFDRSAQKDKMFRDIVNKAMERAGLRSIEEKSAFLQDAIGEDYQTLEYQTWIERLAERIRLIGVDQGTPVSQAIQAAASIWKSKRIIMSVN